MFIRHPSRVSGRKEILKSLVDRMSCIPIQFYYNSFFFNCCVDGYYSMLPRLSWYQVNYQPNMNKNGLRKYLAYTVNLPANQQQPSRRRRDIGNQTGTDPITQSIEFEIGTQTECTNPRNKDVPCNGPVRDGQKFRYFHCNHM